MATGQENKKDFFDKLSSLSGVFIAIAGFMATYIYNNNQIKLQEAKTNADINVSKIDLMEKCMKYVISSNPKEREFGYSVFVINGYQDLALKLIDVKSDSAGIEIIQNIASNEKSKFSNEAKTILSKLTANQEAILSKRSETKYASDKPLGFSVSHFENFWDSATITNTKIKFVFIKATQGKSFHDASCFKNVAFAKKYRLDYSLYHFFMPNSATEEQASNFNEAYRKYGSTLPITVDLEDNQSSPITDKNSYADSVLKFISLLDIKDNNKIMIYTNPSFAKSYLDKRFGSFKLCIAK